MMDSDVEDLYILREQLCYRVEETEHLGRYLVATRDIKKGDVILKDLPMATGPIKGSSLLCPGCYKSPSDVNCKNCGWPICSLECPTIARHEDECAFLRERYDSKLCHADRDWTTYADCLMVMRCLLFKRNDERKWRRLMEMETNWEKWIESPLYSSARKLEELIRSQYAVSTEEYPSNEILTIQAILDINAYEIRLPEVNIQGVYKMASLAEHSCLPNAQKTICSKTLELTLRASKDIPQGSHITTTYCDILWPTWHRQQYLQWSKFFICSCERCHSETECESHLASLVCMDCYSELDDNENETLHVPHAVPIIPRDKTWENICKNYLCSSCKIKIPARDCQLLSKKADDTLAELDKYASFETISTYESWLNNWTLVNQIMPLSSSMEGNDLDVDRDAIYCEKEVSSKRKKRESRFTSSRLLLHPQHSLVLDACHTLFLLYPKEDCSYALLKRKECFGSHLLKATKPLTGISKFRGTISYELAMTKAAILVHQLEEKGMADNLQQLAEEVLQLLGESQELLKYEPVDQPEGKLAQTGASQLEKLTLFFSQLFP